MWEKLIEVAANSGLWALLFVVLFFVQIKETKIREDKYQALIDDLAGKLKVVNDIKESVEEIIEKL